MHIAEYKNKKSPNNVIKLEGEIPTYITNGGFISIDRNPPLKVYGLGFQPAKSIPEIPRWFLKKYLSKDSVVLDPFAGSGTTIIEALMFGASIYWVDYNPLSQLICKVKTTNFTFNKARDALRNIIAKREKQKYFKNTVEFSNKEFWFQKPVIEALEILKELIGDLDRDIQSIFWLALSLTVRKTSNMNDSMILAARRPNVSEIPRRDKDDVYSYFDNYSQKTINAVEEWDLLLNGQLKKSKEIEECDAKDLRGDWMCDAVVTSPPYINAIDYVWASKFELHWLGFVKNNQERLNLYSKEIGTERITSEEYKKLGKTGNLHLDDLIKKIYEGHIYKATKGQNQLRARVVYKYFIDMRQHFIVCRNHLQRKGYYCFTIGDVSRICGVEIPVAELLKEIATEVGFKEIFRFHLILKNRKLNIPRNVEWAGTIKHDTTIVLERV